MCVPHCYRHCRTKIQDVSTQHKEINEIIISIITMLSMLVFIFSYFSLIQYRGTYHMQWYPKIYESHIRIPYSEPLFKSKLSVIGYYNGDEMACSIKLPDMSVSEMEMIYPKNKSIDGYFSDYYSDDCHLGKVSPDIFFLYIAISFICLLCCFIIEYVYVRYIYIPNLKQQQIEQFVSEKIVDN